VLPGAQDRGGAGETIAARFLFVAIPFAAAVASGFTIAWAVAVIGGTVFLLDAEFSVPISVPIGIGASFAVGVAGARAGAVFVAVAACE
jgi:hypothetical protein